MKKYETITLTNDELEECAVSIGKAYDILDSEQQKTFVPGILGFAIMRWLNLKFNKDVTITDEQLLQIYSRFAELKTKTDEFNEQTEKFENLMKP